MDTRANPVFSPTQTMAFLRDPAAWYFRYVMKWHPRSIGKKELAGFLGTAFADGAAAFHNTLTRHCGLASVEQTKDAAAVALESIKESKARVTLLGQTVYEDQSESWNLLEKRAAEFVFKYALNFPTIGYSAQDIISSELTLPDHGNCRIDLALQTGYGPMVLDFKAKLTLDIKYQAQTLREFEANWQMMHYAWAYGEVIGEPIRRFAILLLVLEPKSRLPVLHPVVVDPELMQMWVQSARQVWRAMEGIRTRQPFTLDPIPWCTFTFYSRFGREDWADAIQKCHLDESLLTTSYVKEPERA